MKLYVTCPEDIWSGWFSPEELFYEPGCRRNPKQLPIWRWNRALETAEDIMTSSGQDDARRDNEGPYAMILPNPGGEELIVVAIKLDNNGTTCVVSPVALPWLAEHEEPIR